MSDENGKAKRKRSSSQYMAVPRGPKGERYDTFPTLKECKASVTEEGVYDWCCIRGTEEMEVETVTQKKFKKVKAKRDVVEPDKQ